MNQVVRTSLVHSGQDQTLRQHSGEPPNRHLGAELEARQHHMTFGNRGIQHSHVLLAADPRTLLQDPQLRLELVVDGALEQGDAHRVDVQVSCLHLGHELDDQLQVVVVTRDLAHQSLNPIPSDLVDSLLQQRLQDLPNLGIVHLLVGLDELQELEAPGEV